jgi:hypothetical protein
VSEAVKLAILVSNAPLIAPAPKVSSEQRGDISSVLFFDPTVREQFHREGDSVPFAALGVSHGSTLYGGSGSPSDHSTTSGYRPQNFHAHQRGLVSIAEAELTRFECVYRLGSYLRGTQLHRNRWFLVPD